MRERIVLHILTKKHTDFYEICHKCSLLFFLSAIVEGVKTTLEVGIRNIFCQKLLKTQFIKYTVSKFVKLVFF